MIKEKKQEFTLRISQANRSQLVVIIYEIIHAYLDEAVECNGNGDWNGFRESVRKAQSFINELMEALDFKYPISVELMRLYLYMNRTLIRAVTKKDPDELKGAFIVLEKLKTGFQGITAQDSSAPVMKNTQQVYAGLTYGRGSLNETCQYKGTRYC